MSAVDEFESQSPIDGDASDEDVDVDVEVENTDAPKANAKGGAKTKGATGKGRNKKPVKGASKKKAVKVVKKADPAAENADGDSPSVDETETKEVKVTNNEYRSATGVLVSRPTSKDVKIGNFSLSSYGKLLIADTTIELTIGRRYGLIGPNGSGKSTFLKCLAHREVPIPDHIDIFFLEEEAAPSELTALESVIAHVEKKIQAYESAAEKATEEFGPDSEIVTDLYSRLDELEPTQFKARAGKLLHGLGFDESTVHKKTKDMSGGWRMRVALAQALFAKPTLLLLDEPTNHLDLEACVWLENYLSTYDRCLIVVSHSQDFLNGVCTNVIHITPQRKLQVYGGNYDTFVQVKSEMEVNQMKKYRKEQDDIKHLKAFIASCGTYSNLVRQGKSKQKIIDKMVAAGLTEAVVSEPVFNFRFPSVEPLPPPVLAFQDVAFTYSGDMKHALYQHLNLGVTMDSRIALVGPNGAGKSTLLKLMVGELNPTQGVIRRHLNLNIGKYNQHSNEQLDQNATPLDFIRSKFDDRKLNEEEWRQYLGKYGVRGAQQTSPIGKMSDGQKSRLVFCLMSVTRPNFVCLDEPTNHLDIECIDSLADAIKVYEGAVVLVSHDFRLIDQIAKEIWVCDEKTVTRWKGGIRDYKKSLMKKMGLQF
jgi:ATP-binding cassette subfamily F protein 2